ncbi:hypothetical protein [Microbacterium abyssi]|uniref:hypothetical protein n=1 Tax=Microbacterium abyssi TaxID=2782166 RepID=UPI001887A21C|nr:hypothetical protein [Microbacterium sp. A18JL241]
MTGAFGNVDVTVIPRIYGASELGVLSITAPDDAHPRVEYIGGELFVGLDETDVAVTRGQAEAWTRPFREVLAESASAAGPLPEPADGVILVEDEALAAAVLIDPVARLAAAQVEGDPVVFVLSRARLAIVGADDESGVARVLDLAEELYEAGGALVSAHPITLSDGAWAPFPWRERFASLTLRFERVLRLFSVRAYEAQTAALARPDVRYIDPKIRVLDTGVTTTFATWPRGVASLLPVVDNVIVADASSDGTQLSVATMAQFLEAGGEAIIRTGLSPARYFVPGDQPS